MLALQKSTDGGTTFQQVSVDVADYTLSGGTVATTFYSVKDSQNNTYILCLGTAGINQNAKLIKITSTGVKSVASINQPYAFQKVSESAMQLSRDEARIYVILSANSSGARGFYYINTDFANGDTVSPVNTGVSIAGSTSVVKFAIYQDQYIWVASGTTVKIYNYDTKAELASVGMGSISSFVGICCDVNNVLYSVTISGATNWMTKVVFNGVNTLTNIGITNAAVSVNKTQWKQMLLDRFGDLIILTNSGTASTLFKYSNTGTLIDTVNLSVGTNRGAYGLQVYSSDNGTKCWVQFSNDLGTWRTAETTAQGQVFGAVSKIRNNGVTVYGDDHGGDNNYSVWCP